MLTHIVLLGGGYASIWAYRSLCRQLRDQLKRGQVHITVVSPLDSHVFHGWTAEALTGVIQFKNRLSPLRQVMPKARHLLGEATAICRKEQKVTVRQANGQECVLYYDHLLLGIGSYDCQQVPGLSTYGYQVKGLADLQKSIHTIQTLVAEAAVSDAATASRLLRFAVAGAGFTGVEMAANLAEYLQVLMRPHASLRQVKPVVSLLYSSRTILPDIETRFPRMHAYACRQLDAYGIVRFSHARLAKVDAHGAWLASGELVEASMVIGTIGQSRLVLEGTQDLQRDAQGRIHLTTWLRVPGAKNIWGGGDACHVRHCQSRKPCPSNALWAIKHGEYAGRNIARAVLGKAPKPFSYKGLGQSASLGLGKGITELYGFQFTGILAWVMRWFFFLYFMPSRQAMLNTVGDWWLLLLKGRTHTRHKMIHLTTRTSKSVSAGPDFMAA